MKLEFTKVLITNLLKEKKEIYKKRKSLENSENQKRLENKMRC